MRHGANLRAVRRSSVLILKLTDEDTAGFTSLLAASLAVVYYVKNSVTPTIEIDSGTLAVTGTGTTATTIDASGSFVDLYADTGTVAVNAVKNSDVQVGNGSLQQIQGTVAVASTDRTAKLQVVALGDSSRQGTLQPTVIGNWLTGLSPASIGYSVGQVQTTIDLGLNEGLTVGGSNGLNGLGLLTVIGDGQSNALVLQDESGTAIPGGAPAGATSVQSSLTYSVSGSDLQRTASYSYSTSAGHVGGASYSDISYSGISSLSLDGSNNGATYRVIGTTAPTVITTGTGTNLIQMAATPSSLAGTLAIRGVGFSNTLDYSGFTGDVLVDLPLGIATDVSGGISGIQNVNGGIGNNILVGSGGNVLTGGTGLNLLIAGQSASVLKGGPGDDILVGGTTDANIAALDAVMAEWSNSGASYGTRVANLLTGGGINALAVLNASSFHTNGGGNTLDGGAGTDLYYGLLPADSARPDTTDWNPILGEIFVDPNGEHLAVQIAPTSISAPTLLLDGSQVLSNSSSAWPMLQPGTHTLADAVGTGSVSFTVNPNGTVGYDPGLEGILTTDATKHTLNVVGAPVTINASSLSAPTILVDSRLPETSAAPLKPLYLLPGTHSVGDAAGTGAVWFTVNSNGTVGYDPGLEGILTTDATKHTLNVVGAPVTIQGTALDGPNVLVDSRLESASTAPLFLHLLPGIHIVQDGIGVTSFTINPDGTVDFTDPLDDGLSVRATTTPTVKSLS
jgi:hypothetical protein